MVLRTVLKAGLKPIYLALFSLTLLAVMAGSGALMVLAGKGREVFLFGAGIAVGMSLVSALSLELGQLRPEPLARMPLAPMPLADMQAAVVRAMAAIQLAEQHPHLLLNHYRTPQKASDIHLELALELECRRLLDRLHLLLAGAVTDEGYCHYCAELNAHADDCPVTAAQRLYCQGKDRRVPWREFKKTLPLDVIQ